LIGDAAHSIHPQAGQGLNMGLLDAVYLANCIIKNARTGNNIGELISLQEY
jgi:2-octaprenylphenol hydroxylase